MDEPENQKQKFEDLLPDQEWFNRTYERFLIMEKLIAIAYNLYSDPQYQREEAVKTLLRVVDEHLIYPLEEK